MYCEKTGDYEFSIHCNNLELESIYQGLVLAMNQEQDETRKLLIKRAIREIEKTDKTIEF